MSAEKKAPKKAYVIGAGLAGLSAATALAARGVAVSCIEAAGQAGGRCRSYFDPAFDGVIDNGNHLVLSGNRAVYAISGSHRRARGADRAGRSAVDFVDLQSGARWTLQPNDGPLPWWVASPARAGARHRASDYLAYARLLFAGKAPDHRRCVAWPGRLWDRLMQPFLLAALNTEPEDASAQLAGAVLRETLAKGGQAYRPRIAIPTLAAAFVDPALAFLEAQRRARCAWASGCAPSPSAGRAARGAGISRRHHPAGAGRRGDAGGAALGRQGSGAGPDRARSNFRAIVNAPFQVARRRSTSAPAILGVIGGTAEWIFYFADRISVTVSGADAIVDKDRDELAQLLWADVAKALGMTARLAQMADRQGKARHLRRHAGAGRQAPDRRNPLAQLYLWPATGPRPACPPPSKGAVRSGETAAALALRQLSL